MKATIIRLTGRFAEPQEAVLKWETDDGPTYERVQDTAIAMIHRYGLDIGDRLTVTEEEVA